LDPRCDGHHKKSLFSRLSLLAGMLAAAQKRREFSTLGIPDGNRVHFEPIDCLIGFGQRWRSDAQAARLALGLKPPDLEASRP
jgi:hypothetical protein